MDIILPPPNPETRCYIVEIEEGVWLAPWEGDPGRTLDKENAKTFTSRFKANKALGKAREFEFRGSYPDAKLTTVYVIKE